MLSIVEMIKIIWLFLFNIISIDSESLREDARKIGLGLTSAGVLGYILQFDKVTSSESMLLFVVGMLIWVAALLKPKSDSKDEDTNSE